MKKLVLASGSPRRRQLLTLLNIEFQSVTTAADESRVDDESAPAMVERLSHLKAAAAQTIFPDALIIAADTDVELDGAILGKPQDSAEAHNMLLTLRNRYHNVFTGLTLAEGDRTETDLVHTRVLMRPYSEVEIDEYVASGDPFDKAAGYAVQHNEFRPVARVEGCFANVMGLPLCRLYHALASHIEVPAPQLQCINHPEENCSVPQLVLDNSIAGH